MSDYGIVTESGAVRFERLLPAGVERVWDHLARSELRRLWFAAGEMDLRPGGALTLVFRNSELAPDGEAVPEKYCQYEGMVSKGEIVLAEPPRRLVFLWFEEAGPPTEVTWELEPRGERTLFTLTHRRLPNRAMLVDVSGGWHLHLDVLETLLAGRPRAPFWPTNARYTEEYEGRIPAE
ncbi:MAG TPA: SRPBCC family protein [Allosphingosinicella sp.]|nr:SRPBCC family protein [Allosphingosinicella sp.]